MAKVFIQQLGRSVQFPDGMSNEQIRSAIETQILPKYAPRPEESFEGSQTELPMTPERREQMLQDERSILGSFTTGFKRSLRGTKDVFTEGGIRALGESVADKVGLDRREEQIDAHKRYLKATQKMEEDMPSTIADIRDIGQRGMPLKERLTDPEFYKDLADWGAGAFGYVTGEASQVVGSMALAPITGGTSAVTGIANLIGKPIAKEAAKKTASSFALKAVVAPKMFNESYYNLLDGDANGDPNLAKVMTLGVINTYLEGMLGKALYGKLQGEGIDKLSNSMFSRYVKGFTKGALTEGGTEFSQTFLNQFADDWKLSPEEKWEIANATAIGTFGGGKLSGTTNALISPQDPLVKKQKQFENEKFIDTKALTAVEKGGGLDIQSDPVSKQEEVEQIKEEESKRDETPDEMFDRLKGASSNFFNGTTLDTSKAAISPDGTVIGGKVKDALDRRDTPPSEIKDTLDRRDYPTPEVRTAEEIRGKKKKKGDKKPKLTPQEEQAQFRETDDYKAGVQYVESELDRIKGSGTQGLKIAQSLRKSINDQTLSVGDTVMALHSGRILNDILPGDLDYSIEFAKNLTAPKLDNNNNPVLDEDGNPELIQIQGKLSGKVMSIALDMTSVKQNASPQELIKYQTETASHEGFHVLQKVFEAHDKSASKIVGREFGDLNSIINYENSSVAKWMKKLDPNLHEELVQMNRQNSGIKGSELQAFAFGAWNNAKRSGKTPVMAGGLSRYFNFLHKYFQRMGSYLRGQGFRNSEDVFNMISSGAYARSFDGQGMHTSKVAETNTVENSGRSWMYTDATMRKRYNFPEIANRPMPVNDSGSTTVTRAKLSKRPSDPKENIVLPRGADYFDARTRVRDGFGAIHIARNHHKEIKDYTPFTGIVGFATDVITKGRPKMVKGDASSTLFEYKGQGYQYPGVVVVRRPSSGNPYIVTAYVRTKPKGWSKVEYQKELRKQGQNDEYSQRGIKDHFYLRNNPDFELDPVTVTQRDTEANLPEKFRRIDDALEEYPDPLANEEAWQNYLSKVYNDNTNLLKAPDWALRINKDMKAWSSWYKGLSEKQLKAAEEGFKSLDELGEQYKNGSATPESTGLLSAWVYLSRMQSAFPHESGFLEFAEGALPFIRKAINGTFTADPELVQFTGSRGKTSLNRFIEEGTFPKEYVKALEEKGLKKGTKSTKYAKTTARKLEEGRKDLKGKKREQFGLLPHEIAVKGRSDLDDYYLMIPTVLPEGSPGQPATTNINSFGRDFLRVVGDSRQKLTRIHEAIADQSLDGKQTRREVLKIIGDDTVGIANKILSFAILMSGKQDIMVLDRIQINQLWTGSQTNKVYDDIALAFNSSHGVAIYEALEASLGSQLKTLFEQSGRDPNIATMGRYHWESWVRASGQEVAHPTIRALINYANKEKLPFHNIGSTEGRFHRKLFGIQYVNDSVHGKGFVYTSPLNGDEIWFNSSETLNKTLDPKELKKLNIVPKWFPGVSAFEGGTIAWKDYAGVDQVALDEHIRSKGKKVANGQQHQEVYRKSSKDQNTTNPARSKRAGDRQYAAHLARWEYGSKPDSTAVNARIPQSYKGTNRRDGRGNVEVVHKPLAEVQQAFQSNGISAPNFIEYTGTQENAQTFYDSIQNSKQDNPFASAVYVYDVEEYQGMKLFLTEDNQAGFAIKGDDIVSVFNTKGSPHNFVTVSLIQLAVQNGGRKLDAFDTVLPQLYQMSGFRVVSRIGWNEQEAPPGWDKNLFKDFKEGEPDVVFMVYDPHNFEIYKPTDGIFFKGNGNKSDYDQAVKYQTVAVDAYGQHFKKTQVSAKLEEGQKFIADPEAEYSARTQAEKQEAIDNLKFEELLTSYVLDPTIGRENLANRIKNDPKLTKMTRDALPKKDVIPLYRSISYYGSPKPETLISASMTPQASDSFIQQAFEGKASIGMEGKIYRYDVPRDKIIGYLPAYTKNLQPTHNKAVKALGVGQDTFGDKFKKVTNPVVDAKKLLGEQEETIVDVSDVIPVPLEMVDGKPLSPHSTEYNGFVRGVISGEIQTPEDFPSNRTVLDALNWMKISGYEDARKLEKKKGRNVSDKQFMEMFSEDFKFMENKARQDTIDNYRNFYQMNEEEYSARRQDPQTFDNVIVDRSDSSLINYLNSLGDHSFKGLGARLEQEIFDSMAKIANIERSQVFKETGKYELRDASRSAYKKSMMAKNTAGRAEMVLIHGVPFIRSDGSMGIREGSPSLVEIYKRLTSRQEYRDYGEYAIARRGQLLKKQGKENLITEEQIAVGLSKANPKFEKMFDDYQTYNKMFLDFLVETEVITPTERVSLGAYDYIPFYREMDTAQYNKRNGVAFSEDVLGPKISQVLNDPNPYIKKYTGGTQPIGDIMDNTVKNTQAFLRAAVNNMAMKENVKLLQEEGIGKHIKKKAEQRRLDNVYYVTYRENGKKVFYDVEDPHVYTALASLSPNQSKGLFRIMESIGKVFRDLITHQPAFMVANLIRGEVAGLVSVDAPVTPVLGSIKGFAEALKNGEVIKELKLNSGVGGFSFGDDSTDTAKAIRRDIRLRNRDYRIIDTPLLATDLVSKAWGGLTKTGEASELAFRHAVAESLMKSVDPNTGRLYTKAEAFYQALNVINFNRKGSMTTTLGQILGTLVPLVPFLNARLQGLYRTFDPLFTNRQASRMRFLRNGALLTIASFFMYDLASDDERYESEPLWRKLNYHIIYGDDGERYLIPKAFEIGAIFSTLPELVLGAIRKEDSEELYQGLKMTFLNTFSFNPTPQAVKPLVEMALNFDMFKSQPIDNYAQMNYLPSQRLSPTTPGISQKLSAMGEEVLGTTLSPNQITKLVTGYLGSFGTMFLTGSDVLMSNSGLMPERPTGVYGDGFFGKALELSGFGRFKKDELDPSNQFITNFYDTKKEIDQIHNTVNLLIRDAKMEEARELFQENKHLLKYKKSMNSFYQSFKEINARLRAVKMSETLSGEQKRSRTIQLNRRKHQVAKRFNDLYMKIKKEQK